MNFGENLQNLLKEHNITQKRFASMLHIAPTTLNGYIRYDHEPNFDTLKQMAAILNVSTDELLGHQTTPALNKNEYALIERMRRLSPEMQNIVYDFVQSMEKRGTKQTRGK